MFHVEQCERGVNMAWVASNAYLGLADMQNNAKIIWANFKSKGYTLNATAAMLGNMQTESTINPTIWENLTVDYTKGYGLTQWTPATKYINWAGDNWENPDRELDRITWEINNNELWFRNPNAPIVDPPITFMAFAHSTETPEILANYFLWYYEHPTNINQPARATQARYWYDYLKNIVPVPLPKKSKLIYYLKRWW